MVLSGVGTWPSIAEYKLLEDVSNMNTAEPVSEPSVAEVVAAIVLQLREVAAKADALVMSVSAYMDGNARVVLAEVLGGSDEPAPAPLLLQGVAWAEAETQRLAVIVAALEVMLGALSKRIGQL